MAKKLVQFSSEQSKKSLSYTKLLGEKNIEDKFEKIIIPFKWDILIDGDTWITIGT
jgi:hypothetical protein